MKDIEKVLEKILLKDTTNNNNIRISQGTIKGILKINDFYSFKEYIKDNRISMQSHIINILCHICSDISILHLQDIFNLIKIKEIKEEYDEVWLKWELSINELITFLQSKKIINE